MAAESGVSSIISGGAGLLSGLFGKSAAKDASEAKQAAYGSLQGVNIPSTQQAAKQADVSSYTGKLNLLQETDPGAYSAYMKAGTTMGDVLGDRYGSMASARDAVNQAQSEGMTMQPGLADAERIAADQAAQELSAGRTLTPEQQAELMRSGLAVTSASGGVAGSDAQRSGLGRLMVTDQEKFRAQRVANAQNLEQQSQQIRANRTNLLSNLAQNQIALPTAQTNFATAINTAAGQRLPASYGLTGADIANLISSNQALENYKKLGAAGAYAEGKAGQQSGLSGMLGGAGNMLSGVFDAFGKN